MSAEHIRILCGQCGAIFRKGRTPRGSTCCCPCCFLVGKYIPNTEHGPDLEYDGVINWNSDEEV